MMDKNTKLYDEDGNYIGTIEELIKMVVEELEKNLIENFKPHYQICPMGLYWSSQYECADCNLNDFCTFLKKEES